MDAGPGGTDWYALAVSSGLLDDRREFLVLLPHGTHTHQAALLPHGAHTHQAALQKRSQPCGRRAAPEVWTRVRLLDCSS
ncbi:hypothetical protein [Streptomyces sp. t39]|uniref:hypothetical protein n=1 Tax=Streptomyces sp. t39 TaxID=1828156 RepID=UPI0011CDC33E|nr:hypothetical protein [Streptomyces sp. t39]TXS49876.1 hypothetical protein EAO77_28655 [Streptomyces sp. t39]